jgi:hypothetical protein
MAVGQADGTVPFDVGEKGGVDSVKTSEVVTEVMLDTGRVSFRDKEGKCRAEGVGGWKRFTPVDAQSEPDSRALCPRAIFLYTCKTAEVGDPVVRRSGCGVCRVYPRSRYSTEAPADCPPGLLDL